MRGYLAVLLTSVIKCLLLSAGGALPGVCGGTAMIPETLGVLGQAGNLFPFTCFSYKHG